VTHRFAKCVLHIGTEKTGTTTLQYFLDANCTALLQKGFFVPKSLARNSGLANHERLTTYALRDEKINDELRISAGIKSAKMVKKHRDSVAEQLKAEVASDAANVSTLLLSNEHCHSRLVELDEVARLRDMLKTFAESFEVIVYIRPQHELATSLYDQALKVGYFDIDILPFANPTSKLWVDRRYFEYDNLVKLWGRAFGRKNLRVRLFDRKQLLQQSIVHDFLNLIGVSPNGMYQVTDQNRSIGRTLQQALNAINRFESESPGSVRPELRDRIIAAFSSGTSEPSMKPTRQEAIKFLRQFDKGNEYVRQQFFPDRPILFEPDFSTFPSKKPKRPPDQEVLIRALVHILELEGNTNLL
jgi:hypothetical protein